MFRVKYNGWNIEVDSVEELNSLIGKREENIEVTNFIKPKIRKPRTSTRKNHFKRWTKTEDNKLWSMRFKIKSATAKELNRTTHAVKSRLAVLKKQREYF